MGLDIYLHRITNFDETREREKEYEARSQKIWNEICGEDTRYEDIPQEKKDEAHRLSDAIAKELDLDEYGSANAKDRESVELPSEKHPDCYWKIGYFRSSYNPAGFNSVMDKLIGKDLYHIFQPPEDEYEFNPDWRRALNRAKFMRDDLKKLLKTLGSYKITSIEPNIFGHGMVPTTPGEALNKFMDTIKSHKTGGFNWFENASGHYYLKPNMQLVAALPGFDNYLGKQVPVTYLVYKTKKGEGYDAYLEELDVCIEACEWVLKQPDPENYYLSWSG